MIRKTRNKLYAASQLEVGDRFYRAGDKTKFVYQLVKGEVKQTSYRTYQFFAVPSNIIDNPKIEIDKYVKFMKPIMGDTQVVYLTSIK